MVYKNVPQPSEEAVDYLIGKNREEARQNGPDAWAATKILQLEADASRPGNIPFEGTQNVAKAVRKVLTEIVKENPDSIKGKLRKDLGALTTAIIKEKPVYLTSEGLQLTKPKKAA